MTAEEKFRKVMREFGNKELKSGGSGNIVTDKSQAIAIAFCEAQQINKSFGRYKEGGELYKTGGELMREFRADDYFPTGLGYEFMFSDKEVADRMASKYGVNIIEDTGNYYVPLENTMMAEGDATKEKKGKKQFYEQHGIGSSKYTVSFYDGRKHKDGSDFYGIKTFKNKKDLKAFKDKLLSEGYVVKYGEGGEIKNQYKGKTAEEVWKGWNTGQRLHFIQDHTYRKQHTPSTQEELSKKAYNFLPTHFKKELEKHISSGQYAQGGEVDDLEVMEHLNIPKGDWKTLTDKEKEVNRNIFIKDGEYGAKMRKFNDKVYKLVDKKNGRIAIDKFKKLIGKKELKQIMIVNGYRFEKSFLAPYYKLIN